MGTFLCLKICHEPKGNSKELGQKDNLTISSCLPDSGQVTESSGQALPSQGMKPRQLLLMEQLEERREEGRGADLKVGGKNATSDLPEPRTVLNERPHRHWSHIRTDQSPPVNVTAGSRHHVPTAQQQLSHLHVTRTGVLCRDCMLVSYLQSGAGYLIINSTATGR